MYNSDDENLSDIEINNKPKYPPFPCPENIFIYERETKDNSNVLDGDINGYDSKGFSEIFNDIFSPAKDNLNSLLNDNDNDNINDNINDNDNDNDYYSFNPYNIPDTIKENPSNDNTDNKNNSIIINNEEKDKKESNLKGDIFEVKHDWNIYLKNKTYVDWVFSLSLIFAIFPRKKGRKTEEDKALGIYKIQHSNQTNDNARTKVFNRCFKIIGKVVKNICEKMGFKISDFIKDTSNKCLTNEETEKYCRMTIEHILINNKQKRGDRNHNRNEYNKIKASKKYDDAVLLKTILKMTFGEVLLKFLNDDNFVKDLDPTNNDFTTFTDNFGDKYSEERKEEVLKTLKNIAYKSETL